MTFLLIVSMFGLWFDPTGTRTRDPRCYITDAVHKKYEGPRTYIGCERNTRSHNISNFGGRHVTPTDWDINETKGRIFSFQVQDIWVATKRNTNIKDNLPKYISRIIQLTLNNRLSTNNGFTSMNMKIIKYSSSKIA